MANVFWVPREARWDALLALGSQPDLGVQLDRALDLIERENPALKDVLPKVYASAPLAPETLGQLVSTIAKIGFGSNPDEARDVLGRVYEYFIKEFARAEGHRGGEFYTPANVVRLLVQMLRLLAVRAGLLHRLPRNDWSAPAVLDLGPALVERAGLVEDAVDHGVEAAAVEVQELAVGAQDLLDAQPDLGLEVAPLGPVDAEPWNAPAAGLRRTDVDRRPMRAILELPIDDDLPAEVDRLEAPVAAVTGP